MDGVWIVIDLSRSYRYFTTRQTTAYATKYAMTKQEITANLTLNIFYWTLH